MRLMNVLKLALGSTVAIAGMAFAQGGPANDVPGDSPSAMPPSQAPQGQGQGQGMMPPQAQPSAPNDQMQQQAPMAHDPAPTGHAGKAMLGPTDQEFISRAAPDGMAEVQLGRLAQSQASSPAVKDFGQRMVRDHSRVNDQLKSIADKQGIALPTQVTAEQQATYDRLSKLQGKDFDQAYLSEMTKDHDDVIALFQKEAQDGQNPQLRSLAKKTLPTLKQHDDLAKRDLKNM